MKILYLATGIFDKGGISRYCRYQIEALRQAPGVGQVYVMSLHPCQGDVFEEKFRVEKAYAGVSFSSKSRFALDALRAVVRFGADVVWANHIALSPLASLAAFIGRGNSIVNIYGREMWSGLGRFGSFSLGHCNTIVADCHFTAEWAQKNLGIKSGKTRVIWDCVDIEKFQPGPPNPEIARKYGIPISSGRVRLMTIGRLESEQMHKGYHRIIQTVSEIKEILPVEYIIGGAGPALPHLRKLATELGVQDRVHFTGSITEPDLPLVYRLADIFVLISDRGRGRGEGIPLTPLEAAACAKPILVGDEDGSQEAVKNGINGFILNPHDRQGLIKRLQLLVNNQDVRNRMGIAARQRIEKHHSFDGFAAATWEVLHKIHQTPGN